MGSGNIHRQDIEKIVGTLAPERVLQLLGDVQRNNLNTVTGELHPAAYALLEQYHKNDDPQTLSANTKNAIANLLRDIHQGMTRASLPPVENMTVSATPAAASASPGETLSSRNAIDPWSLRMTSLGQFIHSLLDGSMDSDVRDALQEVIKNAGSLRYLPPDAKDVSAFPDASGFVGTVAHPSLLPSTMQKVNFGEFLNGKYFAMMIEQPRSPVWQHLHDVGLVEKAHALSRIMGGTISYFVQKILSNALSLQLHCIAALPTVKEYEQRLQAQSSSPSVSDSLSSQIHALIDAISGDVPPMSHIEVMERYYLALAFSLFREMGEATTFSLKKLEKYIPTFCNDASVQATYPALRRAFHDYKIRVGTDAHGKFFLCPRDAFTPSGLGEPPCNLDVNVLPAITRERALCADVPAEECENWVSGPLPPEDQMIAASRKLWLDGIGAFRALFTGDMSGDRQVVFTAIDACSEFLSGIKMWGLHAHQGGHFADVPSTATPTSGPSLLTAKLQSRSAEREARLDVEYNVAPCTPVWRAIASIYAIVYDISHLDDDERRGYMVNFLLALPRKISWILQQNIVVAEADVGKEMQVKINLHPQDHLPSIVQAHSRSITRVPAQSEQEMRIRVQLAARYYEYYLRQTNDTSLHHFLVNPAEIPKITSTLFANRLQRVESFADAQSIGAFGDVCRALHLGEEDFRNVQLIRAGEKLFFLHRISEAPSHGIFGFSPESDQEVVLDRVVAAHPELDGEIEHQRDQWVSGEIPSLRQIEERYLEIHVVSDAGQAIGASDADDVRSPASTPGTSSDAEREHDEGEDQREAQKVRCIRDVLLQLCITGRLDCRTKGASYVCNHVDSETAQIFERGSGPDGKTVIRIPGAAVTFIVFPGQKTRVVLNAEMANEAFQGMSAERIDETYGATDITFSTEEQFMRSVRKYIEERLDPNNRLMNYPLLSEQNPSPIRRLASDVQSASRFIYDIFAQIVRHLGKDGIRSVELGAVNSIRSGVIVWPLGSANNGMTFLAHLYDELPPSFQETFPVSTTLKNLTYAKARAVFGWAKNTALGYEAEHFPAQSRVGIVQEQTVGAVVSTVRNDPGNPQE